DQFIGALGVDRVTLVGNDTGGAISQITAANHPEHIGRMLLTNCDAFENFLPPFFRPLQWAAKVPGMLTATMQGPRIAASGRTPLGLGWLSKHDPGGAPLEEWVRPYLGDAGIRRDTIKVLKGIDPKFTFEAAEKLRSFDRPSLLAWAAEDRFFKLSFAEKLADTIAGARLETIDDCYTFVSEDQPDRLAELIAGFVREPSAAKACVSAPRP